MKFSITRLCGGKALMVSSNTDLGIDMVKGVDLLSDIGEIKEHDDLMIIMIWNEMEVTIYPQGKVMFHPLSDKEVAVRYATELLGILV